MKVRKTKQQQQNSPGGSALVLAVILTGMLAIVGMLFVMTGRVEKTATSSISDEKDLNLAVDTVIERVEELLILDLEPSSARYCYYDYPDVNNRWLASLEPIEQGGNYIWPQVSNIYGPPISLSVAPTVVGDSGLDAAPGDGADADGDGVSDSMWVELLDMSSSRARPIYAAVRVIDNAAMLNANTAFEFNPTADIESIDGSSPLQINLMALSDRPADRTGPNYPADRAELLSLRTYDPTYLNDLQTYERSVIWHWCPTANPPSEYYRYLPFDISDELEMRNRFVLNHGAIDTRLEEWAGEFRPSTVNRTPFDTPSDLTEWFNTSYDSGPLNLDYCYRHLVTTYSMDHIIAPDGARMVNVNGVNEPNVADLYQAIGRGLADGGVPEGPPRNLLAGQMSVNIRDFRDNDSNVSVFDIPPADGSYDVFGFERPCIYISELVYAVKDGNESYAIELYKPYGEDADPHNWRLVIDNPRGFEDISVPVNVFEGTNQYHVIEWDPCNLIEVIWTEAGTIYPPDEATNVRRGVVLSWEQIAGADSYDVYLGTDFNDVNNADSSVYEGNTPGTTYKPSSVLDPDITYYWRIDGLDDGSLISTAQVRRFTTGDAVGYKTDIHELPGSGSPVFTNGSRVELRRPVPGGVEVVVDAMEVPVWLNDVEGTVGTNSFHRDITRHKCISRLWDPDGESAPKPDTLGRWTSYESADDVYVQAHPYLDPNVYGDSGFRNIGEITSVFSRPAYFRPGEDPIALGVVGYPLNSLDTAGEARLVFINLLNAPAYQRIFNYLTVFDPAADDIDNDGDGLMNETGLDQTPEFKVPGRININTAPWYVLAQLPWLSTHEGLSPPGYGTLARQIVAYRAAAGGFRSIGELMQIPQMAYFARSTQQGDLIVFPDLTYEDGASDDVEEEHLIFARISNLVTVRSDVFTAYILVRIGADGPQKRAIAIFDRSDVYPDGSGGTIGRVRLRAIHPVHDPR